MKHNARQIAWWRWLAHAAVLGGGLFIAEYSVRSGRVADLYLAAPSQVVVELAKLLAGYGLLRHLAVTLQEFAVGFAAAVAVGTGVGIALARIRAFDGFARPYLSALMAVPKVVLIPLLTIWLGIGLISKAALVFMFSLFPVLYNTAAGVRQTAESHVKVARVFGATRWQVLHKVVLPSAVPTFFAGLRVAAPAGLLGALFGEMLASKEGLGNVLTKAAQLYNTGQLFAVIFLTTSLSVLLIHAIDLVEQKVFLRWRGDPSRIPTAAPTGNQEAGRARRGTRAAARADISRANPVMTTNYTHRT